MKLFEGLKNYRPYCSAVIVAAGSASRMQGVDKIMTELCGIPVIARSIAAFEEALCVDEIVVVTRENRVDTIRELVEQQGFSKVKAVVPGGDSRTASVALGLKALSKKTVLVAIHDGARPLVPGGVIEETIKMASRHHAAAPAVPVKDTVKEANPSGRVVKTLDRSVLRAIQTPQVFDLDLLLAAQEKARKERVEYTDDCGAMEALGCPVFLTEGSEENLKITTQLDLKIAELIVKERNCQ